MNDQTTLRASGVWLAVAAVLLFFAILFHGPLHPDLEVQMTRIGESASRWAVLHWMAAAAFSSFAIAALLALMSRSRLTRTGRTVSAWAVIFIGSLWTLTTAVAEATAVSGLSAARDLALLEAWWAFAEGYANGFSILAVAVAVVAWNEFKDPLRLLPAWSAAAGAVAGLLSFAGWVFGVWFDVGPANLVWLFASGAMCAWLAWFGAELARVGDPAEAAPAD